MNIHVNANNLHTGGGNIILKDLISASKGFININFFFYVDPRFQIHDINYENITFTKIKIYKRFLTYFLIEKNSEKNDIIIYLTNIPPPAKHKCKTILLQQNRFVVDYHPLIDYPIKTKLQLYLQKILFLIHHKNTDYIVVQSETMSTILKKTINKNKIILIPYRNKEDKFYDSTNSQQILSDTFLYVASDAPHKNHKKLIEAWCFLAKDNIYPKLILTIDINTKLYRFINKKKEVYNLNIEVKPNLEMEEILNLYYQSTALIYPSLFESYGLPLVEARQYGLPVLASELDYVRDIMDPEETFDPNSPKSINRSVKRFLNKKDKKSDIVSPEDFINTVIEI